MSRASLYRLLAWLSPSYPVGAYSYSHGLEFAVETGLVGDRAALVSWISAIVGHGSAQVDAVLLAHAYRAVEARDSGAFDEVAGLAAALRATAETALETTAQGRAFLDTTRAAWPHDALDWAAARPAPVVAYPVAVAAACAAWAVPLPDAAAGFLHAVAANLVSAGVRLVPLGQTDGQIAIAELAQPIIEAAETALATPLDDAGSATPVVEWASMQHETQYTRLFRS